ncbi:MAG TPA: TMEM175 family protein, partial [Actinomycetota bacterium]
MAGRRGLIELGSERVEAFSDAVFAVIITIMALELQAPQGHTLVDVRDDLL